MLYLNLVLCIMISQKQVYFEVRFRPYYYFATVRSEFSFLSKKQMRIKLQFIVS